jgi:hypothetical protein
MLRKETEAKLKLKAPQREKKRGNIIDESHVLCATCYVCGIKKVVRKERR